MSQDAKDPVESIVAQHRVALASLPFADRADFEDGQRGLLGSAESCVIRDESGRVVWDNLLRVPRRGRAGVNASEPVAAVDVDRDAGRL